MEGRWPCLAPSSPSDNLLLELAEELWFCSSVIRLPSLSLPSFPFQSHPDSSTLLAQLMLSTTRPPSSPSLPPLQRVQSEPVPQSFHPWDPVEEEITSCSCHSNGYGHSDKAYLGDSFCDDEDQIIRLLPPLNDEHDLLHPMNAECKHEEAFLAKGECDVTDGVMIEEKQSDLALPASVSASLEAEDALSGFYGVGVLLKDEHHRRLESGKHCMERQDVLDFVLPKEWSEMTRSKFAQFNKNSKDMIHSIHVNGCRDIYATCNLPYS